MTNKVYTISEKTLDSKIRKAVEAGVQSGRKIKVRELTPYQQTERKLYAYNDVLKYINDCKEELEDMKKYGLKDTSKGIVFMPSGSRMSPEDMLEAKMQDLQYRIQSNEREIKRIDSALESIKNDEYYKIIELKYLNVKRLTDDEIADKIGCEKTTAYRNRNRLVSSLSARLYGFE